MKQSRKGFHRHALAAAVVLALAGAAAQAQVSTSTLKGQVTAGATAAQPGLPVVAVNKDNGNTYRTTTRSDGSYVLPGLAPGSYSIRIEGKTSDLITLQIGETASLDLALADSGTQQVTVIGSANRRSVKESQVGTNVSRKTIENLPQTTRNFMSSADLAPGVAFQTDAGGNTSIQAGSQNFDHVNVFIDGIGQKNNILRGGTTGQDSSRGNPFPQSAIAEYKVLSQNYKAEFDQVSSAAIAAITKSGTNELHGEVYADRTGTNWRAKSIPEKQREAAGVPLPPSSKYEYGFSLGGPIIEDKVHFFVAYDGKNIDDSRQFVPLHLNLLPKAGVVNDLIAKQGSHVDPFHEDLLFGKIDAQLTDDQKLTFTAKLRRENDRLAEDRNLSVPGNNKSRTNDETAFDVKHEWSFGDFLSEARLGYEEYRWNPHSSSTSPLIKYKVSTSTPQVLTASQDVAFDGGSPDNQDRAQKGMFLSEELTYSGMKGHVFKGGAKVKSMKYDLKGTSQSVDIVETLIDNVTGNPYYSSGLCTGTGVSASGLASDQCKITKATPGVDVSYKNTQVGLYFQDDWSLTKQLELNLGVRWDYESNMLNNSYVTPADRVTVLTVTPDAAGRDFSVGAPAPGQTYADSLAKGGIKIADYIADGHSRKAYTGAIAPRVGASYDVLGDKASVVFGGWGRSYDRTMANHALDELQKNMNPGQGEIWLIKNDFKLPYADQFSVGFRQAVGDWNAEIALSQIYAKNQFQWFSGNRNFDGGFGKMDGQDVTPMWGGPKGYGTLILGDFNGENKTNALLMKATKPYTKASGWELNVAYTLSDAKTTHHDWNNDNFDWTAGRPNRNWYNSKLVDTHRLVVGGFAENLLPLGMTLSGKFAWSSGLPRRIESCPSWPTCFVTEKVGSASKQLDVGVGKEIPVGPGRLALTLNILNLFASDNWQGDNLDTTRGDPRTVRAAVAYKF